MQEKPGSYLKKTFSASYPSCRDTLPENYGLSANPKLSIQTNFNKTLINKKSTLFTQLNNLAFHKLCKINKIPTGTKQLHTGPKSKIL